MFGDWDSNANVPPTPPSPARDGRTAHLAQLHGRLWSRLYGNLARRRRNWYERHPEARRRLGRPVISVGNLTVGGSGKTPIVAHIARTLLEFGERPSILSRGYGRSDRVDGVVTVRDADRIQTDLERAGDEPLMLARALDGVTVLVSANRHMAGVVAERRYGCTVHVLDDGFQHFALERDVDLLAAYSRDLREGVPLPAGRLREPTDVASTADALIVLDETSEEAARQAESLGVRRAFSAARMVHDPLLLEPTGRQAPVAGTTRVLAVAGVSQPERFFADARAQGWSIAGQLAYRDHHAYTRADVDAILEAARQVRADLILTTEKDAIRLRRHRPFPCPIGWVPLEIAIEPQSEFRQWLWDGLERARQGRAPARDFAS